MFVLNYIVSLGASVMMPIIFTILGVLLGVKFGKSLKCGLTVGIGFIGLNIVTALLSDNLGPVVSKMVKIYGLHLNVIDIGWPAASSVAFSTQVGMLIIPIGLLFNMLMIFTKTTETVNIDIWNYWHFAFIGSIVYMLTGSMMWGIFAALINYAITMVIADYTAPSFAKFYDKLDGISIPQAFCTGFAPIAYVLNKLLDLIPGIDKINIDADSMEKKFGVFGEPIFLGTIIGVILAAIARYPVKDMLKLGVTMGAVFVLIPKMASLLIEGLVPISKATQDVIKRKFNKNTHLYIGMSPAIVIGHPTTLVVSLILVPVILLLSVIIPGNQFLPLASLSGLVYIFPLILPITKGNVFRTFIIGTILLIGGLWFASDMAPIFTKAAKFAQVTIPKGSSMVASIDYAASPLSWSIYRLCNLKTIGIIVLVAVTIGLMLMNRRRIVKSRNAQSTSQSI